MKKRNYFAVCAAISAAVGLAGAGIVTYAEDLNLQQTADASAASEDNTFQKTALFGNDSEPSLLPFTEDEKNDADEGGITIGTSAGSSSELSIQEIASNSMPAMVAITNTSVQDLSDYYGSFFGNGGYGNFGGQNGFGGFGNGQTVESVSMGTGVIIADTEDSIYIATNAHVISDAKELSVAFVDESAAEAEIVGSDTKNDLAVIKVDKSNLDADTLSAITVIPVGSSDELKVGESVVAIGNALGYGQSVSSGIVSALNRSIYSQNMSTGEAEETAGMIQTDASINPGNSGGALLNMKGELIGINSAKYADEEVEGMGYAIPIDYASPILKALANGETASSSFGQGGSNQKPGSQNENTVRLGISCTTVTDEYAEYYGIPAGVYVNSVERGSDAEAAGIEEGDIITAIGDTKVSSAADLKEALSAYQAGDSAEITLARQSNLFGQSEMQYGTLTVTFSEASGRTM